MKSIRLFSLPVLLFSLLLTSPVSAATIYDNLGSLTAGSDSITGYYGKVGVSFTTGSTAVSLWDVQLLLSGNSAGTGSISVDLYQGPNAPASYYGFTDVYPTATYLGNIGTKSDSALTANLSPVDFALLSPYSLSADTRYWIIASTDNGSTARWGWTTDLSGTGVAGEYYYNYALGSRLNSYVSEYDPNKRGPYQMLVSTDPPSTDPPATAIAPTVVPEPSTFLLLGAGLAGLGFLRRRIRK